MKAFKKAVLSCMAVGALSTVIAASAFAAATTTAEYKDGKVKSGLDFSTYGSDQMTVLVISKEADEALADGGTLSASDILYIDQEAADTEGIFQSMGVRANYAEGDKDAEGNEIKGDGTLKYGTYVVKIGGDSGAIITAEFTVSASGIKIQLGDCDGITGIDVGDALAILSHISETKILTGHNLIAADCDGIANIDVGDALAILSHISETKLLGTVTVQE